MRKPTKQANAVVEAGETTGKEAGAAASPEARRLAAVVLEVLAGLKPPGEAARGLGISVSRYYQLEGRALDGLVQACEPRRGRHSGTDLVDLRRECERLRHECARQQALVRAARRSVGLEEAPAAGAAQEKPRRRRRPVVRALKAVAQLRAAGEGSRIEKSESEPLPVPVTSEPAPQS